MKKLIFAFLFLATNSFALELHTYDQINAAVSTGKSIHILIHYSQCTAPSAKPEQSGSSSVFTPNEMSINNDNGYIAASLMHFTLNNPDFLGKPIYEFSRYTLLNNNSVSLSSQVLDAVTYSPLTNKVTYNCQLNTGAKVYI
ncbi:MAG: hypothetical protein EPO11_07650 [Gammaproteobacteria bacterium]|nr:MAG: hypothetical protein EPO11_07650 [Gammaproteobacteria bacterium]